jgi:adhesin transport system membrane fusion protein
VASPFDRTLRALAADSARPSWWAWGIALLLGTIWMGWFTFGSVTVYEVSGQARIEAQAAAHPVAALQGGALMSSSLALGRPVRAGDVLLELDTRGALLRLKEETQRLAGMPARRAALGDEMASLVAASRHEQQATAAALRSADARAGEVSAQLEFSTEYERRMASQVQGGGVAEVDLLRARSEARRQQAQREALQAESQRLANDAQARGGQLRSRIDALQGQMATLDAEAATLATSVARLESEIERLRVRAPVDGTLAEVTALQPGAWVAEGQHVATVLPRSGLRVVAAFAPAGALGRIRPGQTARLRLDGFPWAQHGSLEARVQEVAGEVRDGQVRVELALAPQAAGVGPALQHGLGGTVEVALESVAPAVLLLRSMGRSVASRPPPAAVAQAPAATGAKP